MIIVTKRRRKILWQIFPSFLIITVLSLTAVTWYSTTFFKSFFLNNTEKELTTRAEFVKREFISRYPAFAHNSSDIETDDIDRLCKDIGKDTETRITIVLPSGKVVGDSLGNISSMENHKHRYEIALAMKDKKGVAIRKSGTLGENMMYIALPVFQNTNFSLPNSNFDQNNSHDNSILWIVRVAISITGIEKEIKSIQKNIFVALLITVIAAAGASLFVARRITRPIEEMRAGTNNFANGNLTTHLPLPDSEELFQLALTMNLMAQTLDEKIKNLEDRGMELEAIHSSMKEGVIAVDPEEKIITANHAASTMFGYPADIIKGRNIYEISRNYELQKLIRKALSNHEPVEDDIVLSGFDDRIYNIHSTALCNSSGIRLGTLIIFHDITRIRKLETMHKDFAANVSHELKTPLTSIKGFVETLENLIKEEHLNSYNNKDASDNGSSLDFYLENSVKNGAKDFKNGQSIKFIKIIQKNVDRLIALINDLLALSRVEREEGATVRLEPHDITQVVQRAIDACISMSSSKNIAIEYGLQYNSNNGAKNNITALIDPILMEQAIVNLLDNAIKYSNSGDKIVVACEKEEYERETTNNIQKSNTPQNIGKSDALQNIEKNNTQNIGKKLPSIVINITDYGVGIGKEHISRIFQRFYRVDKSRSRDMGGTGLGLAIVKHIVRYHKGDIAVTSTLGKGSTFKITLPLQSLS
ncbi:MAG: PAS domain-containing protein [Desulfamplus sp.]|nr:PAS domain-containing protein [Desulfamplus sp.]